MKVTFFLYRFYQENFFLDKYVRYNLTIYPVVVVALTGSACKNFSLSSPTTNGIFIGESFWTVSSSHKRRPVNSSTSLPCIRSRKTFFLKNII